MIIKKKIVMKQQNNKEERNQLRLGVDIKSLKDHEFTAQIYVTYKGNPDLGMKNFRSTPTQSIVNPKVEIELNNCFRSYMFQATKNELRERLSDGFIIQLWHSDRLKKDVLLGIVKLELKDVLKQNFRKKKDAYALVYDVILPVDEVNEAEEPIRKIGALRTIIYLEDLGPVSLLKQKGFDIKNFIEEGDFYEGQSQVPEPVLPSQNINSEIKEVGNKIELQDLERKVVWELQVWKKAEEAKTRIALKQKEADFWTNLSEHQKKSDLEKEKQFKKIEANLGLIENKLKAKMNELIKREQKLVIGEQELQNKIGEISKEVFYKDEEIQRLKKRQKQQKASLIKEKSNLELQIGKLRAQNAKLRVEVQQARKQDEKAPINILKSELSHKCMEIKELKKQLENCLEIKEEFKAYYQRMKTQVLELRTKLQESTQKYRQSTHQNNLLRTTIRHLQQQLTTIKQQQFYQQQKYRNYEDEEYEISQENMPQKERLIHLKKQLLQSGYTIDDPLIKEYDRRIAML